MASVWVAGVEVWRPPEQTFLSAERGRSFRGLASSSPATRRGCVDADTLGLQPIKPPPAQAHDAEREVYAVVLARGRLKDLHRAAVACGARIRERLIQAGLLLDRKSVV